MNREQRKALRERVAAKNSEAPAKVAKPTAPLPSRPPMHKQPRRPRLPDGATFRVQFDATKTTWHGVLTISPDGLYQLEFTDKAKSVFGLLSKLDTQYRKSLPDGHPGKGASPA